MGGFVKSEVNQFVGGPDTLWTAEAYRFESRRAFERVGQMESSGRQDLADAAESWGIADTYYFENTWIPGKVLERGSLTGGSGRSEGIELTEVPGTYYYEKQQILAMIGLAGVFRLLGKERIGADGKC